MGILNEEQLDQLRGSAPAPDERLKLAREVASMYAPSTFSGSKATLTAWHLSCLQGQFDDRQEVQIALAALSAGRKAGLEEAMKVAESLADLTYFNLAKDAATAIRKLIDDDK